MHSNFSLCIILSQVSNSSFEIFPRVPTLSGITVTCMFQYFFSFLARSSFSFSFTFNLWWSPFFLWSPVLHFLFRPLGTVPVAPFTIGITVTFMFRGWVPCVMAKVLDFDLVVCDFELPVVLSRSLSDKYPWERYEPPYSSPIYELNDTKRMTFILND